MKKGINEKQEKFCRAVACGETKTQAAITAGYSPRSAASIASRLSLDKDIQNRINFLIEDAANTLGITPIKLLKGVQDVLERCLSAKPVMIYNKETKAYEESGEWQFDSKGAIKASELLMKYLHMFKDAQKTEMHIMLTPEQERLLENFKTRQRE